MPNYNVQEVLKGKIIVGDGGSKGTFSFRILLLVALLVLCF